MGRYYLTEEISHHVKGRLIGNASLPISGVSSLRRASHHHIALYLPEFGEVLLGHSQAGCVILADEALATSQSLTAAIIVQSPLDAIKLTSEMLSSSSQPHTLEASIANTAIIHPKARLDGAIVIGEKTWVDANAHINDNAIIGSGVNIGEGVTIGRNAKIGDNVTIAPFCTISPNVIIGEGCVIGAKPYQYIKSKGIWQGGHAYGAVALQTDVAIGANTVIEQGVFADTLIGEGVKVGPLVQIAHDVVIGSHSAIISHAAIGAHATTGQHCIIGGGCLIASQISIADDVVLTGGGTVSRSIRQPGIYSSAVNVKPHHRWRKNLARLHQLDSIVKRFRRLENQVKEREKETT